MLLKVLKALAEAMPMTAAFLRIWSLLLALMVVLLLLALLGVVLVVWSNL